MVRKLLIGVLLLTPLGVYPFLRDSGIDHPAPPRKPFQLAKNERLAMECFSAFPGLPFPGNLPWHAFEEIGEDQTQARYQLATRGFFAAPNQGFPGNVPWECLLKISDDPDYQMYQPEYRLDLARKDPVRFLEKSLERYVQDVRGYRLMFNKQERVQGKLRDPERILCHFKEKPFSVHMDWKEGAGLASKSLYVDGERKGKLAARLQFAGIPGPKVERAVDDPSAKATSRFPITEFGMYHGAKRTLDSIHEARSRGRLHLRFDGVESVEKVGGRPCYKFTRDPYDPPEDDGLVMMYFYIDQETLFQVGSVLYDGKNQLIAEYYFRDIELNPTFDANQFTEKAL
jgi:hypothetical protein